MWRKIARCSGCNADHIYLRINPFKLWVGRWVRNRRGLFLKKGEEKLTKPHAKTGCPTRIICTVAHYFLIVIIIIIIIKHS